MKIYDLSFPVSVDDMVFPGTSKMNYLRTKTIEKDNYNLGLASINTHAGTHTDAPLHFIDNGKSLDQVDINSYVGNAFIIDCSTKQAFDIIDVNDAEPYEEQIRECKRVIFKTGWSKKFNTPEYYTDYPVISLELAKWLVKKGIVLVGVEPPSLNPALYIEVHKTFLNSDVAIVEGLTNLEKLPGSRIFFFGVPIRLVDGDGFPIRALAIEF